MSSSAEPRGLRAVALSIQILPLLVLLPLDVGCTRVKVVDTSAEFTRDMSLVCGDAGQTQRPSDRVAATRTMDTYVVQILELTNLTASAGDPTACQQCAATGGGCRVMMQQCYCGGPTTADPSHLSMTMSGVRLGALDYGELYCLRVMALDRSSLQGDPPARCTCSDGWIPPGLSPDKARLCAVSTPYAAGPLGFELQVQCPSDGQTFTSCIGAGNP